MNTLGSAFAILLGGAMVTGMYLAGVVCGVAMAIKMEEKDKKKESE